MNRKSDKDRLLRDIFGAPDYMEFRKRLRQNSLNELRKQKSRRRLWKVLALAAAVLIPLILANIFVQSRSDRIRIVRSKKPNDAMVHDAKWKDANRLEILRTQEFLAQTRKEFEALEVVRTRRDLPLPLLSDKELLDSIPHDGCLLAQGEDGIDRVLVFDPEREIWQREFGFDTAPPN